MKDIFSKLMLSILKYYIIFKIIHLFLSKRVNTEENEKILAKLHGKKSLMILNNEVFEKLKTISETSKSSL